MEDAADPEAGREGPALGRLGRAALFQLLARTAVMRGVSFVGSIVLARVLTPADFGLYAVIAAIVTFLTMFGDLGLPAGLVRQRAEPARRDLATAWTAQQIVMVTGVVLIWILAPVLLVIAPDLRPDAVWQLRVGSLALLFAGLRMLPQLLLVRALRFGPIAVAEVLMQFSFYAVAIPAAWLGAGAWSFVLALVAQSAIGTIVVNLAWKSWPGVAADIATLQRLLRFGLPLQLSTLVNWVSENAIPLAGTFAGGVTGIGILQFASRIAHLAAGIDEIIGRVSFSVMSRLQDDPPRRSRAAGRVLEATTIAVVAVEGWLIAIAPILVPVLFSEKWTPAIVPLQLMAFAAFATVPARVLRSLLWASGRSDATLRMAILVAAISMLLAPPLVAVAGLPGGGIAALLGGITSLVLHRRASSGLLGGSWPRVLTIYASGVLAIAAGSLALAGTGGLVGLAAATAAFGIAYPALLLVTSRDQVREAWAAVRGRSSADASG
ncbi:MAG: oligosaccharide flippase family protein [Dehalococcoidia bacterium]